MYKKENILNLVNEIRKDIGHEVSNIKIHEIIYKNNELWIITEDRPDKSAIIGKGGWVVGKLKEKLDINKIHVESYGDFLLKKHSLQLSIKTLDQFENKAITNLKKLAIAKLENIYSFNINEYLQNNVFDKNEKEQAIVALSGGVDSSFSLILAKFLGFNPISITIDPGTIVLPNQFKKNIDSLNKKLDIKHEYIKVDYNEIIEESLNGKYHPCGRCSKVIENTIYDYAKEKNINLIIYGDMLSTGTQCITKQKKEIYRLNLPASLSTGKQEIKSLTRNFNLDEFDGFGCPLLYEVHKKYPHMKKYSIQRILRETRASALEPGEALDLIWSFYKA